jgi:hypothetical protein
MPVRFFVAIALASTLVGCQVVSGLSGVDLDGNGHGGGPSGNVCQQANKRIATCANPTGAAGQGSGVIGTVHFDAACPKPDACKAGCYVAATTCKEINDPSAPGGVDSCTKGCPLN